LKLKEQCESGSSDYFFKRCNQALSTQGQHGENGIRALDSIYDLPISSNH
jgi:hypothetical protein